ncbi:hypothetical protein LTS10_000492 [Elasticomyces elasticus]|nr:hypothetical protein LTS10_000492 [Elasticomyces elasticus]
MDSFMQSLQSPRDSNIVVGNKTPETFFVQQHLLERTSRYFVRALRNERLGEKTEPGVLRFPEDKPAVWKLLLFWMYKQELPGEVFDHDLVPAVRTWALGDKLCIPAFQNHVMLAMVWYFRNKNITFRTLKAAVHSSLTGSPMRLLMAEELVVSGAEFFSQDALDELDGHQFLSQVLQSQEQLSSYTRGLFGDGGIESLAELNEYMVGEGLTEMNSARKILRGAQCENVPPAT